jgi:hypothetical protein
VALDLGALSTATTAATGLGNLIMVNPQKNVGYQAQNAPVTPGVPAASNSNKSFLFDYEGENKITLSSDITDHYVEDNTAINDQISLKPEMVTVQGYVGELNDIVPNLFGIPKFITDKLTTISAYVPGLSKTASKVLNTATQVYNVASSIANSAVSALDSLTGTSTPVQTKQQIAYGKFYGYWKARTLFTIQTPWQVFTNMAIQSLTVTQDAETRVISDFDITFKIMRFAATSPAPKTMQGQLNQQSQSKLTKGLQTLAGDASQGIQSLFKAVTP